MPAFGKSIDGMEEASDSRRKSSSSSSSSKRTPGGSRSFFRRSASPAAEPEKVLMADGRRMRKSDSADMLEAGLHGGDTDEPCSAASSATPSSGSASTVVGSAEDSLVHGAWSVSLDPLALSLFEEAKVEHVGETEARWADEQPTYAKLEMPAKMLLNSWMFRLFTICAIITDIALVFCVHWNNADRKQLGFVLISIIIMATLTVDIITRLLALRKAFFKSVFSYLEIAVLLLCILDEIFTTTLPFAVGRLVRAVFMFRSTLDAVADLAVDKMLAKNLGDIVYISPENATAKPSEGMLVIEKTHFLPKAFENLHSPVTIKGGFIELVYVDLNYNRLSRKREDRHLVVVLKNILLLVGPTAGGTHWMDELTKEDVALNKNRLVEMVAERLVDPILSGQKPGKKRSNEHEPATFLGKLRQQLSSGLLRLVDLSSVKVDILNLEVRYEDFDLMGVPVCIGFRARQTWCRITSGNKDATLGKDDARFRAVACWSHEQGVQEEPEETPMQKRLSICSASSRRSSLSAEENGGMVKMALRSTQICAWCDHGEKVHRRPEKRRRTVDSVLSGVRSARSSRLGTRSSGHGTRSMFTTSPKSLSSRDTATKGPHRRAADVYDSRDRGSTLTMNGACTSPSKEDVKTQPFSSKLRNMATSIVDRSPQGPSSSSDNGHAMEATPSFESGAWRTRTPPSLSPPASDWYVERRQNRVPTNPMKAVVAERSLSLTSMHRSTATTLSRLFSNTTGLGSPTGSRVSKVSRFSNMSSPGNSETFTQFFARDPPEVSKAARLFKRQGILERFKIAARAAVEKKKRQKSVRMLDMGSVAEAVMEKRLGSRMFSRFWDRIMPHSYILTPTAVSLHALSQLPQQGETQNGPPTEVLDVEIPKLGVQLSRTQTLILGELQHNVLEWLKMDNRMSRMPVTRLRDAKDGKKFECARSWWSYAVHSVIIAINPGSKFAANLQLLRQAGLSGRYMLLLVQKGLFAESRKRDLARLTKSSAAVFRTWSRLRIRIAESSLLDPNVEVEGQEELINEVRKRYRDRTLRWYDEKEKKLRSLQVSLRLPVIAKARIEARRIVLEEATGQSLSLQPMLGPKASDDEQAQRDYPFMDVGDSVRSGVETESTSAHLMVVSDTSTVQRGVGDDPRQVRIHIASIKFVVVVEQNFKSSTLFGDFFQEDWLWQQLRSLRQQRWLPQEEIPILRELVRCQLHHLTVTLSSTAPMEEWNILTSAPTEVFDHTGDPQVLDAPHSAKRGRHSTALPMPRLVSPRPQARYGDRRRYTGGPNPVPLSPVPFDCLGNLFPGWVGLEVSVASFEVVHCQAPAFAPSLYNIVSRGAFRDVDASKPVLPWSTTRSSGTAPSRLRGRRPTEEGGIMFLLRLAQWSQENLPGSSQGIITMQTCALKVLEYPPLAMELLNFFLPVLRPLLPGFRQPSKEEDPLQLALVRARLHKDQESRLRRWQKFQTRLFEFTSGIENAGADVSTRWRLMLSMGDIQVTMATPYNKHGRAYLVSHVLVPSAVQHFERMPLPLSSALGPCWRGALALPGAAGVFSAALGRALGVDMLAGGIQRGPPPQCSSPAESDGDELEEEQGWGAISSPWQNMTPQAAGREEHWHTPDWRPSECFRAHFATVPPDKLESELVSCLSAAAGRAADAAAGPAEVSEVIAV